MGLSLIIGAYPILLATSNEHEFSWKWGIGHSKIQYIANFTSLRLDGDIFSATPVDQTNTSLYWWRHQMETFSALLAICAGFPAQRPVARSFDVFFDLRLNKRLSSLNNREAGDLRSFHVHYDVIVMT